MTAAGGKTLFEAFAANALLRLLFASPCCSFAENPCNLGQLYLKLGLGDLVKQQQQNSPGENGGVGEGGCLNFKVHKLCKLWWGTLERWGEGHFAINFPKCNSKDEGWYMQNVAAARLHLSNCEYFSGWESCTTGYKYCTRRIRITSGYAAAGHVCRMQF